MPLPVGTCRISDPAERDRVRHEFGVRRLAFATFGMWLEGKSWQNWTRFSSARVSFRRLADQRIWAEMLDLTP